MTHGTCGLPATPHKRADHARSKPRSRPRAKPPPSRRAAAPQHGTGPSAAGNDDGCTVCIRRCWFRWTFAEGPPEPTGGYLSTTREYLSTPVGRCTSTRCMLQFRLYAAWYLLHCTLHVVASSQPSRCALYAEDCQGAMPSLLRQHRRLVLWRRARCSSAITQLRAAGAHARSPVRGCVFAFSFRLFALLVGLARLLACLPPTCAVLVC